MRGWSLGVKAESIKESWSNEMNNKLRSVSKEFCGGIPRGATCECSLLNFKRPRTVTAYSRV